MFRPNLQLTRASGGDSAILGKCATAVVVAVTLGRGVGNVFSRREAPRPTFRCDSPVTWRSRMVNDVRAVGEHRRQKLSASELAIENLTPIVSRQIPTSFGESWNHGALQESCILSVPNLRFQLSPPRTCLEK